MIGERAARLERLVREFAADIASTIAAVVPAETFQLETSWNGERIAMRTGEEGAISLTSAGTQLLRIKLHYECEFDQEGRWISVTKSEFHVFHAEDRQVLFRFEFDRNATGSIPQAHLQFHAHRDAVVDAMYRSGDSTRRGRDRAKIRGGVASVSQLHFPIGGPRFRIALEDVLEMVIEEFGLDTVDASWRRHLADGRERWRRLQLRAAVREAPEESADVLKDLGFVVTPPTDPLPTRSPSMRAI